MERWLTNEIRPYVGLEVIEPHWDLIEIKQGYSVYFDGYVIRKRISGSALSYSEADVEIQTRERRLIVPKTSRGKEKKLNYTSVSGFKAKGVSFSAGISSHDEQCHITARNSRNSVELPFSGYQQLKTKEEIVSWLQQFPTTVPVDYDKKIDRLKNMKNQRYDAVPGDIFRVEIDMHTDGYVLVIGNLRQMEKDNLFSEESVWRSVMTMPLFVRPFLWKTTDRSPSLDNILAAPLSETTVIVMDDNFMRGGYELAYHKELEEDDIVFPIGYGPATAPEKDRIYRLSWGLGTSFKSDADTSYKTGWKFLNHGVYSGIVEDWFGSPAERMWDKTLTHPQYEKEWIQALTEFGFPENITYDEFCIKTGTLTRAEYIEYVLRKYK